MTTWESRNRDDRRVISVDRVWNRLNPGGSAVADPFDERSSVSRRFSPDERTSVERSDPTTPPVSRKRPRVEKIDKIFVRSDDIMGLRISRRVFLRFSRRGAPGRFRSQPSENHTSSELKLILTIDQAANRVRPRAARIAGVSARDHPSRFASFCSIRWEITIDRDRLNRLNSIESSFGIRYIL